MKSILCQALMKGREHRNIAYNDYSVRQKKYPLKFFCHFLSNHSELLHEISHISYSFTVM